MFCFFGIFCDVNILVEFVSYIIDLDIWLVLNVNFKSGEFNIIIKVIGELVILVLIVKDYDGWVLMS